MCVYAQEKIISFQVVSRERLCVRGREGRNEQTKEEEKGSDKRVREKGVGEWKLQTVARRERERLGSRQQDVGCVSGIRELSQAHRVCVCVWQAWENDKGEQQVNRGYRVQVSSLSLLHLSVHARACECACAYLYMHVHVHVRVLGCTCTSM